MASQPTPPAPPRNKGLRAGLIKGNQSFISLDHKALFLGGGMLQGGRLTGHKLNVNELLLGTVCWICFLDDFLMDSISWDSSQSNNHLRDMFQNIFICKSSKSLGCSIF